MVAYTILSYAVLGVIAFGLYFYYHPSARFAGSRLLSLKEKRSAPAGLDELTGSPESQAASKRKRTAPSKPRTPPPPPSLGKQEEEDEEEEDVATFLPSDVTARHLRPDLSSTPVTRLIAPSPHKPRAALSSPAGPTKKQRQNASKREKEKTLKALGEEDRQARLEQYRRAQREEERKFTVAEQRKRAGQGENEWQVVSNRRQQKAPTNGTLPAGKDGEDEQLW